MFGFVLFCVFFTFLCLLLRLPKRPSQAAWWVKIDTETPHCTYYFGPFDSAMEAEQSQSGYVEDLEEEGAKGITVQISQYQPIDLTIYEEEE